MRLTFFLIQGHTKPVKYSSTCFRGRTEKLGIEPATAQFELGLSFAIKREMCVLYRLILAKQLGGS